MNQQWLAAFREAPQASVSNLFAGRAGAGSATRLDVPELLRQWFPQSMKADRAALDDALRSWLLEARKDYTASIRRLGFAAYAKRIGDALITLQLLDLPRTKDAIRADLDAWLRWLAPLRLAPERDPALECLRLLTRGQPDSRHLATWLRIAADRREEYLTVALAGLEQLPNDGDARKNQALMVQALLHRATTVFHEINGARRFFNRRFRSLRGLFPRGPDHWTAILDEALVHLSERVGSDLANDLAESLREQMSPNVRGRRQQSRYSPAPEQEWRQLRNDIDKVDQEPRELAGRLFDLLDRNQKYALGTGHSAPFVRSLCNLGNAILDRHPFGRGQMQELHVMIERALVWEPGNAYCWSLWAQWLQVNGRPDAQEAVLREMLRMFPRNLVARVELARLILRHGEGSWAEAEHHLDSVIEQDSENAHAHAVLARHQYSCGRGPEAATTLQAYLSRKPDDQQAQDLLDSIRMERLPAYVRGNSQDEMRDAAGGDVGDSPLLAASTFAEVLRRGRLSGEFTRALIAGQETPLIEQQSQAGDALAGFYSQWLGLRSTPEPPPHAWAWNACVRWQQIAPLNAWDELAQRFPEAAGETNFLRRLACQDAQKSQSSRRSPMVTTDVCARPVDLFVEQASETWAQLVAAGSPDQSDRDGLACAVMACAAAEAPQFGANVA